MRMSSFLQFTAAESIRPSSGPKFGVQYQVLPYVTAAIDNPSVYLMN